MAMAPASRLPGSLGRRPELLGSPSTPSAGGVAPHLGSAWLADGTGQRAAAAMLLLAMLLAGCGAAAPEPLARPSGSGPVGEPTGDAVGMSEDSCPQVVACTAGAAIEQLDDGEPRSIIDPPCDDNAEDHDAACPEGFYVGETFHALSCGAVRPELVTDEVVATGTWAGDVREVRVIAGVDPTVLLAIDIPGGECADGDLAISDFSMVFVGRYDPSKAQEAICTAAVEEHLQRNSC
jgi:hypothetical protein